MSVTVASHAPAASVADARESTRDFLTRLTPAPAPEVADTVVLVVSELVTNALRHGGGTCTHALTAHRSPLTAHRSPLTAHRSPLTAHRSPLTAHPQSIEVAVHDRSPRMPRPRTPDLHHGTGGFGWPMVNRLSPSTAVAHRAGGGKTVSAHLTRTSTGLAQSPSGAPAQTAQTLTTRPAATAAA